MAQVQAQQADYAKQWDQVVAQTWADLTSKQPFWTALAVITAVSVPQVFLALPIAVAGIGPLPAIMLIVAFGLMNALTMACMAEAFSRHADVRYGNGLLGRVVSDYLGPTGASSLTGTMALRVFLGTLAAYVGLSITLADLTGISPAIWAAVLFALGAFLLAGESISFTVGVTVLLGGASVLLILMLSLLGIAHAQVSYLSYFAVPLVEARSSDPLPLQLVGGVILAAYHGHAYLPQSAKFILTRHPDARSFIWGSVAGTLTITVLLCVWTVAINGALAPHALAGQVGTIVPLLAGEVGPSATLFGSLLVLLLLGTGWVRGSCLLYSLVRERLPARQKPPLLLPRGRRLLEPIRHPLCDHGFVLTAERRPRESTAAVLAERLSTVLHCERARFMVCVAPVLLVFVVTELLLATGCESFSGVWSIAGIIGNSFIAGIFPLLLLVASRRKGDVVPSVVLRFLSHPLFVGGMYLFVLGLLVIHGLVIWQGPVARAAALLAALLAVAMPIVMCRQGAFERRLVVELREDTRSGGEAQFSVIAAGQPAIAVVRLNYRDSERGFKAAAGNVPPLDDLRVATFHLPPTPARELKVRAHRVTANGESESLPAFVEVHDDQGVREFDLHLSSGQVIMPLAGLEPWLRITLAPTTAA
jgi:hypothetical protein